MNSCPNLPLWPVLQKNGKYEAQNEEPVPTPLEQAAWRRNPDDSLVPDVKVVGASSRRGRGRRRGRRGHCDDRKMRCGVGKRFRRVFLCFKWPAACAETMRIKGSRRRCPPCNNHSCFAESNSRYLELMIVEYICEVEEVIEGESRASRCMTARESFTVKPSAAKLHHSPAIRGRDRVNHGRD